MTKNINDNTTSDSIIPCYDGGIAKLMDNKVFRSINEMSSFRGAVERAMAGVYDAEITKEESRHMNLIKLTEKFSIHKNFSLETGCEYYQLCKEVFYVDNPGKKYASRVTSKPCLSYRRVALQHERGDLQWAENVSKYLNIPMVK